jgi:hypothetical protein
MRGITVSKKKAEKKFESENSSIVLNGELVRHSVCETYTQGEYDSEYNCEGEHEAEESIDVIGLKKPNGETVVLAEVINNLFNELYYKCSSQKGLSAHVSYSVTDEYMNEDQLTENMLRVLYGAADAKYSHHFSDLTGYLWTDEIFVVNNHDVYAEIMSLLNSKHSGWRANALPYDYKGGKFLYLKVTFSETL